MISRHFGRTAILLACSTVSFPAFAADPKPADWPQFRGPDRTGVSDDKGLLKEWPKDGPPVAWKCSGMGVGFSSVSIAGNRIFTMGDLKDSADVFAIDRTKGEIIWKVSIGKSGADHPGTRCTPTVDGDSVYALGQFGDFVCLDAKDGKVNWQKNLVKDFKGKAGHWSYAESPLIDGDKVIVTPGGPEAAMLALNKKTGAVIWKGILPPGNTDAGYSSIVAADIDGTRQYIQLMAGGLVSFSADKGVLLWRYGTQKDRLGGTTANIPTPVVKGNEVFASAGYDRGAALITVSSNAGKFDVKEEYWNKDLKNKHGGIIKVGEFLFGDSNDNGQMWCADFKTGKPKWKAERGKGSGSAAPTYADGLLYIHYDNGWVSLVQPSDGKEISTFKIANATKWGWAHPVVVGGKMYIRENDILWCFDVKAKNNG